MAVKTLKVSVKIQLIVTFLCTVSLLRIYTDFNSKTEKYRQLECDKIVFYFCFCFFTMFSSPSQSEQPSPASSSSSSGFAPTHHKRQGNFLEH